MNALKKLIVLLGALGLSACATDEFTHTEHVTPPPQAEAPPPPQPSKPAEPPPPPTTPDEAFRAQKPAPLAGTPHFQAPVPVQKKLKNGLVVYVVENHQLPVVAAELMIKSGSDANPEGKAGLAEFTAVMMDEGTKSRPALKLAEEISDLAMQIGVNTGLDSTRVHLNALAETLPQALDIMADIALHPAFRPEDVERVRKQYLTEQAQRLASPGFLAQAESNRVLYGEKHPWGQVPGGTQQSVAGLKPADLAKWHDTYFVPDNAVLVVSGDVKADTLLPLLEKSFGAWKGKAPAKLKLPDLPKDDTRRIIVVDHAGTQSFVNVTHRMLTAKDADVVPFKTGNYVLGGLFTSRLNLNLREDKGYSYGVRSGLQLNDRTGVFTSGGNIIAKHTAEAIVEMEKEYTRFSNGELTADELSSAKSAYVRSLPSQLETNDAVTATYGTLILDGLPLDYYATLPDKVAAVTQADVARVAQKYVKPETWPVVVVGPMAADKAKLEELKLGEVQLVPPPGSAVPMHAGASGTSADKKPTVVDMKDKKAGKKK